MPRQKVIPVEPRILIVRTQRVMLSVDELVHRVEKLERGFGKHDENFHKVFTVLRKLVAPPDPANREMGFHVREDEVKYRAKPRKKPGAK